jgi:hypothetical protein
MEERWMTCRACGDVGLRWSRRSELEWLLGFFFPVRPYRCNSCYDRQWGLRRPVINVGTGGVVLVALLAVVITVRERLFLAPETDEPIVAQSAAREPTADRSQIETSTSRGSEGSSAEVPEEATKKPPPAAPAANRPVETSPEDAVRIPDSQPVESPAQRVGPVPNVEISKPGSDPGAGRADRVQRSFLGIRAQRTSAGLALVVLTSRPVTAVQQASFKNPRRWVFDLHGLWRKGSSSRIAIDYPGIEAARVGYHSDKLRIVVDLSSPSVELVAVETVPRGLEIRFRN